jgi:hypothetical protein
MINDIASLKVYCEPGFTARYEVLECMEGSPVVDEHVSHESVGAGAQFVPNMQAGPRHLRLMVPGVCWVMALSWLPFRSDERNSSRSGWGSEGLDARGDGEEKCYVYGGIKTQQPKPFENFYHISCLLPLLFPGILHHLIFSLSYIDR